jgi:hypothetical protein
MRPAGVQMSVERTNTSYPRKLRDKERDLLESVLPDGRPGDSHDRRLIGSMTVLGEGRRGEGNLILGFEGDEPDTTSPLAAVIAYGVVETTRDQYSIIVREYVGDQIDVEIVSNKGEEIPDHFEEKRRWTYSTWFPGKPSPATAAPVREIVVDDNLMLVIAKQERRLWVYDKATGINHLIPITNFHNELMLHRNIRDPKIALRSNLFFEDLTSYKDTELQAAFIAYNKLRPKVEVKQSEYVQKEGGLKGLLHKVFSRKA